MKQDDLTSIALPALGTRYRKYPSKVSAKVIFAAINEFWNNNTTTCASDVRVIIFGSDKNTVGRVGVFYFALIMKYCSCQIADCF